jgi:hypothetical protein
MSVQSQELPEGGSRFNCQSVDLTDTEDSEQ